MLREAQHVSRTIEQTVQYRVSENAVNIEMADDRKDLNEYKVAELRTFLEILGAKTTDAKAELVQRLASLNKEAGRDERCVPFPMNQSTMTDDDSEEEAAAEPPREETTIPENVRKEIDLLRRERDLLERELRLTWHEINVSPNSMTSVASMSQDVLEVGKTGTTFTYYV